MKDAERLSMIRADLAAIAPGRWTIAADADGEFIEAQGPMGELVPLCRLHPGATAEEKRFIADAVEHVRFLLGLVERAIRAARATADRAARAAEQAQGKNYAAEAAMKCGEPAFRVFLEERHGLERPLTDERVAQKVRSLCGVTSRREPNGDGEAAEAAIGRWRSLVKDFEAWRRGKR